MAQRLNTLLERPIKFNDVMGMKFEEKKRWLSEEERWGPTIYDLTIEEWSTVLNTLETMKEEDYKGTVGHY